MAGMTLVQTDVLDIDLQDAGPAEGIPVLLLHGWPDAPRGWHAVAERLHAAGFRTLAPALRGSGQTRFRSPERVRDGRGVALAADALALLDALGLERVGVIGHDWGARAAYSLAALAPERVSAVVGLALPFQPRAVFEVPAFEQARAFWYQWFMNVDRGADAVRRDPVGFAQIQWRTWSPPGFYEEAEFVATAESFQNPDWVDVTLSAYRTRFRDDEPTDPDLAGLAAKLAEVDVLDVPTVTILGDDDRCDLPAKSEGLERHFSAGYSRILIGGVGHFPHREAPHEVAEIVIRHLA
jgi:pimeloyl-ACP methyl ester carboxylesterase